MRLCLDEHYSAQIAEALRQRGHDVSAAQEQVELRGLDDVELFAIVRSERRALMTENVADFMPLIHELAARAEDHWGMIFSSSTSMPRGTATIGVFVESLHQLLSGRPREDDLLNQVWWLQPPARSS